VATNPRETQNGEFLVQSCATMWDIVPNPPENNGREPQIAWCNTRCNNFSGAMEGRPTLAYIASNRGDNRVSTSSTMARIARSG
jgi:hypothetical protein